MKKIINIKKLNKAFWCEKSRCCLCVDYECKGRRALHASPLWQIFNDRMEEKNVLCVTSKDCFLLTSLGFLPRFSSSIRFSMASRLDFRLRYTVHWQRSCVATTSRNLAFKPGIWRTDGRSHKSYRAHHRTVEPSKPNRGSILA